MKVYLDTFLFVNFLMNYVVITLLALLKKRKTLSIRILLGAFVGALLGTVYIIIRIRSRGFLFVIMYILTSAIIILVSFGRMSLKEWIRTTIWFYFVAFGVAGLLMTILPLTGMNHPSMSFLLIVAWCIIILGEKSYKRLHHYVKRTRHLYQVSVSFQGKTIKGMGFLDTGNQLREPVSGDPVAIIQYSLFEKLLSKPQKAFFSAYPSLEMDEENPVMVHYIPYHSLGNTKGYLLGIRADVMKVYIEKKWQVYHEPWLGVYEQRLSSQEDYEMLLHEEQCQ